jgi:tetratricopeptide (TPR) repeat protein
MMAKTTARAIVVVCLGLFATYTPSAQPRRLGTIEFQSSGAPAARRAFEEGVALLHSFVYEDAAARFRTAEQIDPSFALAYWFDALTYSHALWGDEDVVGAHAALGRLGPDAGARLAKAPDVRERAWGDAVEALFGDGDLRARSIAFAAGMKRVRAAADDDEAMAFTSLAIMGAARFLPPDQQESAYDEAESLARRVFSHQLNHPGAAHYIIHADDAPGRAVRALAAARTYAAVAPDAVHALHMPAHTFVQLGLWDEAAEATEHAWAVSRAQIQARHQSGAELSFHDLLWLVYVDAQQGRYAAARSRAEEGRDAVAPLDLSHERMEKRLANCFTSFAYVSETGDWKAWPNLTAHDSAIAAAATLGGSSPLERSVIRTCEYNRAVAMAMNGDVSAANVLAPKTRQLGAAAEARGRALAMTRASILEGLVARGAGDQATAVARFREAANEEQGVPPLGPQLFPALEVLGTELLAAGRPKDALDAFDAELARTHNRSNALLGITRAATLLGDADRARDASHTLASNWLRADPAVRRQLK